VCSCGGSRENKVMAAVGGGGGGHGGNRRGRRPPGAIMGRVGRRRKSGRRIF